MEELFRFVAMRPANPASDPQHTLGAQPGLTRELASAGRRRPAVARAWLEKNYLPRAAELVYAARAADLAAAADAERSAEHPKPIGDLVEAAFDQAPAAVAKAVAKEQLLIETALTAATFSGPLTGVDPALLAATATGLALVQLAAGGGDALAVRLTLPDGLAWDQANPPHDTTPLPPTGSDDGAARQQQIEALQQKLQHLTDAVQLVASTPSTPAAPVDTTKASTVAPKGRTVAPRGEELLLTTSASSTLLGADLAGKVAPILRKAGATSLLPAERVEDYSRTTLVQGLAAARVDVLRELGELTAPAPKQAMLLNGVHVDLEGDLTKVEGIKNHLPFPIPAAGEKLKPVGVGDLMLVREQIVGYEAGEVAHIENILRTEKLDRKTRRLESTTTTVDVSVETDKEEERDSQSTDRYDLKRETSDTVKTDTQLKGELSVDAKYGPMVEVKADVSASTQTQTESAVKTSTEFSKEVVSRSVSKVATKVRQEQITKTVQEYEEWYEHGFDNTAVGATNVAGVYQWVDKVSQAQIFNYGKRLLFDTIIPEPARFYIWAQSNATNASITATDPGPFTLKPSDITEGNYQNLAASYGATDVTAPPQEWVTASKSYDQVSDADPHAITKSDLIPIPDGYVARWADWQDWYAYHDTDNRWFKVMVGGSSNIDGMTTSVPFALTSSQIYAYSLNITITCQRVPQLLADWREKTFGSIYTAWLKAKQDYDQAVAAATAQATENVQGRNPGTNAAFVLGELRKGCISELTQQQFDSFGAVVPGPGGTPQLDLAAASEQGKYIAFFEEAFEWEHIAYYFFPYYWGRKSNWRSTALFDDPDPDFGSFLRAGAARVVFPVRPGFESAIVYFLSTGQIWDGGDPPDISSSEYVPILEELEEALQHPGDETPVGDPWTVRTPTTLVKLRADDTLPTWVQQADGTWAPAN